MKIFAKVFYLGKYLYYRLFVSFWLSDFRIIKKFLQDQVYYSLANFNLDVFEFISYFLKVLKVHNIESNLIIDVFLIILYIISTIMWFF